MSLQPESDDSPSVSRRSFLELGLSALAAPLAFAGCDATPKPPPGTVVELASLPEGERVVVMRQDEPIELVRNGATVRARSLFCTHTGCVVKWDPNRSLYQCLCHDGRFDADGNVLLGPPPRPLRAAPIELRGSTVILLDPPPPA
jgi:nitrite reductase/ring-hydroxylating ferredoxin subunit